VGGPVEGAEKGARRDRRVGRGELAASDAVGDERADAAFVPIALGDNRRAQRGRQGVDLEMRGGSFELVDEAEDVRDGELAQPRGERTGGPARAVQRGEHAVERAALTEVEQLVLAGEVVIQDAGREVGGGRDLAHAGAREPDRSERARRRPQDLDAPRLGAP